ncbi:hypothetical protein DPMN_028911 [Dreissena polymorpha]|uniref:Uncharacterized protein n=1 Tax=Dreissena polymorpha TaxID=45954 RepID=A0A9D4LVJ1_DREPO|nr:hypothetical protein DPMN_028911 [Dreissena polymorpha]
MAHKSPGGDFKPTLSPGGDMKPILPILKPIRVTYLSILSLSGLPRGDMNRLLNNALTPGTTLNRHAECIGYAIWDNTEQTCRVHRLYGTTLNRHAECIGYVGQHLTDMQMHRLCGTTLNRHAECIGYMGQHLTDMQSAKAMWDNTLQTCRVHRLCGTTLNRHAECIGYVGQHLTDMQSA